MRRDNELAFLLFDTLYQGKTRCEVLVGQKYVVHRELFFGFSFKFRQPTKDVGNVYVNPQIPEDAKKIAEDTAGFDFALRLARAVCNLRSRLALISSARPASKDGF